MLRCVRTTGRWGDTTLTGRELTTHESGGSQHMKVMFIQTGGTIDKDYPRRSGGYAFEIGTAAVRAILEVMKPTVEWDLTSVAKKDSQELTDEDRSRLIAACDEAD